MNDLVARVLTRRRRLAALFDRASGFAPYPAAAAVRRNPILLVHGFSDSAASMELMKTRLERSGRTIRCVSLQPSDGTVSLKNLAAQLAGYIDKMLPGHTRIDLIGFSMGGIICRYYVQKLDRSRRVERLVTISAPHHGTWLAFLSKRPGCIEMRPGSDFLATLNSDLTSLKQTDFISIWTPFDLMILPPSSSRMTVGREMKLRVAAHPLMILQRRILNAIESSLAK